MWSGPPITTRSSSSEAGHPQFRKANMVDVLFTAEWRTKIFAEHKFELTPSIPLDDLLLQPKGPSTLMDIWKRVADQIVPVTHLALGERLASEMLNHSSWFIACLDTNVDYYAPQNVWGRIFGMEVHTSSGLHPMDLFCYSKVNRAVSYGLITR